ncbi:MAG: DNA repair protein RecN [Bdellovibrionales bacterium]|nr:DNA repair protein RecN [Bdellovibrionales bacterium]NQZ19610.1 DNA repair protein RecN [Bdellovibrionales bacterium]
MLTELKVSQFAIIDSIHIAFNNGLNILSGETGAGKSILIKSLALLMGAKSSSQDIRSHKDQATIEGAFDLSDRNDIQSKLGEMGIEAQDGELIVRRVLQRSGKSKVYLNGSLSSVSDLRKIVFPLVTLSNPTDAPLIEITGQHENKDLMSARYQMDVLDQFCGNMDLRDQCSDVYQSIKDIEQKLEELNQLSMQREQRIDFLEYQIKEIDELSLEENEDEVLNQKIKNLKTQGQWQSWLEESEYALNSSDYAVLSQLKKIMLQAPEYPSLKEWSEQMEQAYNTLEDCAYQLNQLKNSSDDSDESLDFLEDRLSRIRKLQKKFGENVETILESYNEMKAELDQLTNISKTKADLEASKEQRQKEHQKISEKLHKKRTQGAVLLSKEVNNELKDLNMKGLEFIISVHKIEESLSTGFDRIIFQTKTGKADEARELSKAASGGELSRILLSLKQVIGANQFPRTFLFDEVDTGGSGPTAEKVGLKLRNLAEHQQVICVTHLPQVASFGHFHYYIEKRPNQKTVEMSVSLLNNKDRVKEIARLISGEKVSKTSMAHAKQLLADAH